MKRKGQSTLEYAVIIAVVVGALVAMQHYMKRGVEGKLRESTDNIGEQYSAGNMTSKYTTTQIGSTKAKETFGLDSSGNFDQGLSYYKVTQAATQTKRSATGTDAEKVTKKLSEETVWGGKTLDPY